MDYIHDNGGSYRSRAWWIEEIVTKREWIPVPFELTNAGIHEEKSQVAGRGSSVFTASLPSENLQSDAEAFGALQLEGRESEVLSILQTIEPRSQSLAPIPMKNTTVVHANIGTGKPIAVRLLGEGFSRLFSIAVGMERARGGMMLIDEVENGLHYSVMKEVFSNLHDIATRFDVQVFATTHGAECIYAAFEGLENSNARDFTYHRIDRVDDRSKATHFDQEMMETARYHDMEGGTLVGWG